MAIRRTQAAASKPSEIDGCNDLVWAAAFSCISIRHPTTQMTCTDDLPTIAEKLRTAGDSSV